MSEALGIFWGLRRLADDGGRFVLLDLSTAEPKVLVDLIEGLAPFATGVVLAPAQASLWCRHGSPHVGRIDRVANEAELEAARRGGADAVLADAGLAASAQQLGLARLGTDPAADLGLDRAAGSPWVQSVDRPDHARATAAGFLATPAFWAEVRSHSHAARRLHIADHLVPRFQRLTVQALDATPPTWIDTMIGEIST
ncbi:MAG: hypothetical protein ACOC3D_09775 [Pseudomonadota bacterium]